jgi:hypothetical protein
MSKNDSIGMAGGAKNVRPKWAARTLQRPASYMHPRAANLTVFFEADIIYRRKDPFQPRAFEPAEVHWIWRNDQAVAD